MLTAIVVVIVSVTLGTALALAPREGARHVGPIRTFALTAALAVVATHLLPEAVHAIGLWALLAIAVGIAIPDTLRTALAAIWRRRREPGHDEQSIVLEVSYVGLLAHRVGDGLSMGAYALPHHDHHGHADVFIALAAHAVPVTTVFVLAFASARGRRVALLHAVGLAASAIVGIVVASLVTTDWSHGAGGWVAAVVAGLLVHVVMHDLRADPPVGTGGRALDFLAATAGIGVAFVGSDAEHGLGAWGPDTPRRLGEALLELTLETAPMLLLGLLIAAALQSFGPGLPQRWLGRGHPLGQAVRGAVAGAPLPLCSCSVLPVSSGLRARGAAPALVVAFLIATPELGVETLTITARMLGWPFAWLRLGAALGIAIVAGVVVARLAGPDASRADDAPASLPTTAEAPHGRLRRFVASFDELLFHVGAWTALGLVGAAFVQALLPSDSFSDLAGSGADVLVMTALTIPSYVCASSATPLGAVLLTKGFSPGAVLVGLLLGPATNLATLAFLRRAYGLTAAAGAIVAVLVTSWALAFAVNAWLPGLSVHAKDTIADHDHGPMAAASSLVLAGLLLRSLWLSGARVWLSAMLSTDGPGGASMGATHDHDHGHAH